MKKVLTVLVALSMLTMMGLAYADTIHIGDQIRLNYDPNGYSYGHGGAFYLNDINTLDNFYTFCVENQEYFNPGNLYYIGGISDTTLNTNYKLTPAAAYIYSAYRQGLYTSYPGTGIDQNGAIQEAIWYAMGEINTFSLEGALAIYNNALGKWNDIGNVRVLNLYSSYSAETGFSGPVQDQLALVPESSTFLLIGAGFAGVWLLRRRFKS